MSPKFGIDSVALVRALGISAWLTAFRLLPSIALERQLGFRKIALVEAAENLAFNIFAVMLAFSRAGTWALVGASLTRAIVGTALLNIVSPQPIRFQFYSPKLKNSLAVGFGFQAPAIVFFLKDLALPAFLVGDGGHFSLCVEAPPTPRS